MSFMSEKAIDEMNNWELVSSWEQQGPDGAAVSISKRLLSNGWTLYRVYVQSVEVSLTVGSQELANVYAQSIVTGQLGVSCGGIKGGWNYEPTT